MGSIPGGILGHLEQLLLSGMAAITGQPIPSTPRHRYDCWYLTVRCLPGYLGFLVINPYNFLNLQVPEGSCVLQWWQVHRW